MISAFQLTRVPRIEFGAGSTRLLAEKIIPFGRNVLIVTGSERIEENAYWQEQKTLLHKAKLQMSFVRVTTEPSPEFIDEQVNEFRLRQIDVVVGLGGGSAVDAAKAIAGLLRVPNSVMDFLEGVGPELSYQGPVVPFIAVPTTAGTGSEATKNAVLSTIAEDGFKKSFRHETLVPEVAIVDPNWLTSCPPELIAANGMDALTQLMESFLSIKANPVSDMLAESGIRAVRNSLMRWYHNGAGATSEQSDMAYAAMLSGITLAQVGLGSVHGLASPLGAYFPIPHGIVCGTLVAEATQVNITALQQRNAEGPALKKYHKLAEMFCGRHFRESEEAYAFLIKRLTDWTRQMNLPGLNQFGVKEKDFDKIVANARGSSMKTNPIVLLDDEIRSILQARLQC